MGALGGIESILVKAGRGVKSALETCVTLLGAPERAPWEQRAGSPTSGVCLSADPEGVGGQGGCVVRDFGGFGDPLASSDS